MEYSVDNFDSGTVDDSTLNTSETSICPIQPLDLILAKVRGNTISFLVRKIKDQLSIGSELTNDIETLERTVTDSDVPVPNIIDRIQEMKDRLQSEIEKEDI